NTLYITFVHYSVIIQIISDNSNGFDKKKRLVPSVITMHDLSMFRITFNKSCYGRAWKGAKRMVEAILRLFVSEQQAEAVLTSPLVELIFMALFAGFVVAISAHFTLYSKLRKIRNFIRDTNSLE